MKKTFLILAFLGLSAASLKAQMITAVKWSYASKKISKTEAIVFLRASINPGWHLYSQNIMDGGPVKTTFTFTPSKAYTLIGKTIEPQPITKYEKTFMMNVSYFENSVTFQQKVKLTGTPAAIKGKLEYMTCDDKQCLPPEEVEFNIPVK